MNSNLHQAQSHDILRSWQSQRFDISHHKDFVLPLFIGNDDESIEPIESMPEVYRYGGSRAIEYLEPLVYSLGLRSVLLFPVVTKSDKAKINTQSDGKASDSDDDNDVIANDAVSTNSSDSRFSAQSSLTSSSSLAGRGVMSERLVNDHESEATAPANAPSTGSHNPFLNQNEEEDHLLAGEQCNGTAEDVMPAAKVPDAPALPLRAGEIEAVTKVTQIQDVRLIKGMALKDKHNPVLRLIPRLRAKFPKLLIICDVCLCAFTSTGHCCLFEDHARAKASHAPTSNQSTLNNFPISNKTTCQYLAMLSVEYALRGCDVVAPSDMMDGRILTIREKLNDKGLNHVSILSYSAKFASAFYGPFRQATNNAPEFGDRRAYQLPPGSRALALKAVQRDIDQGADFVMVKPAGPYLDIVRDIRERHPEVPVAVYQVSGEYSMLKIAANAGVVDLNLAVREMLTAFRRSGATIIISYFTPELLKGELSINGE